MTCDVNSAVSYMVKEITHICRDMKKRAPGSAGEREAAEYMAEQLRTQCGCDDVKIESFEEHPDGFYGYLYFSAVLDMLCMVFAFRSPWLSIVFALAAILLMLFQFILYHEIVDCFFPRRNSVNVTAVRHSKGIAERRIFLNGHTDAAWEWPVNYYLGGIAFEAHSVLATVGVIYYLILAICALLGAGSWIVQARRLGILFAPFWIGLVFLADKRCTVDGANDNLTGCYMGIAIMKALKDQGMHFEHTEIGVILTGSEEAGLRGAKAWCGAHADDYRDIPTYIYSIDTIHDPLQLMVNERDLNGTVVSDKEMGDVFVSACRERGIPCRKGWVPPMGGATDSAAFTQGGFRSISITGLNHRLERYYHTRRDSFDNLNEEGLRNCFEAVFATVERIDRGVLDHRRSESPESGEGEK